ncbi:MAG TPA: tetratricopeptide repeat protein [Phycisphaerales bacterium]|nr:tetratricopeptide repeat protein [Phycisphaerales bacterium]
MDRLDAAFNALDSEDFQLARTLFAQLVAKNPGDPRPKLGLADALFRLGQHAASAYQAEQALKLCKGSEVMVVKATDALSRAGRPEEGMLHLEQAAKDHPGWSIVKAMLGGYYCDLDRLDDAERMFREALAIDPDMFGAQSGLARTLALQGRSGEAVAIYRKLVWIVPDDQHILEQLAFQLNSADASAAEVYQAHVKLGMHYANFAADFRAAHPATDDPERRLNVAFVTHDFNGHSVSFFLENILRHADRSSMTVYVYFTNANADATTEQLVPLVDRYVHVPSITSLNLAKRVHADGIDVLIDLNGWTSGHRLHAFQLRPAPLQMTYLGYPNTTGIPNIDFRIVDSITDPPGSERLATELLLRIDPCFLCYSPATERARFFPPDWRPPEREPLTGTRPIIFGSFNNATKITDTALGVWGRVLQRVPGSRLLIKARGLRQDGARLAINARLARAGIDPDRFQAVGQTNFIDQHLGMYSSVDVALDTFPYNGTTTTCEALLMGTPVVTLTGDRHVSRVGTSLLTAVGLGHLAAADIDGYVDRCASLANDRNGLTQLHAELPGRFRASPLCDGPAFGRRFSEAVRQAWRARCRHGVGLHALKDKR